MIDKEMLDLICDDVNVRYFIFSNLTTEKGGKIAYERASRKWVLL